MSAWSKVRVHELGLISSHIGAQRTERKVVRFKFSPIADKHARRCTNVTHTAAKFTLRPEVLLTEAHLGKWRWHRGRKEGGQEGATAGHIRRRGCRFSFFLAFFFSETHFPYSHGIYSKGRGTSLSQAGNGRREREVLKLSKHQKRNAGRKKKRRGGDRSREEIAHWRTVPQWGWCLWVCEKPKGATKTNTKGPNQKLARRFISFRPHKTGSWIR